MTVLVTGTAGTMSCKFAGRLVAGTGFDQTISAHSENKSEGRIAA